MNPHYSERAEEFQEGFMQLSEHDNWIVPHNAIQPEKLVFCHSLFLISTTFYHMNSDCSPCTWHFKEKLKDLTNMFICFAVLCEWEHLFSKLKTMCGFFFFFLVPIENRDLPTVCSSLKSIHRKLKNVINLMTKQLPGLKMLPLCKWAIWWN